MLPMFLEKVKEKALRMWPPPEGRTLEVMACICGNPIFVCERDRKRPPFGMDEEVVVLGGGSTSRLCPSCEAFAKLHPAVFEWVLAMLKTHLMRDH